MGTPDMIPLTETKITPSSSSSVPTVVPQQSSSGSPMDRTLSSTEADKRPLISNLVSSEDMRADQVTNRPVIKTEGLVEKLAPLEKLKIPHPPPITTMVPPSYYGHYPDYYQYYNLFSSYYQHQQQQLPQPSADMIHLYNSYLYQNYSAHPKSAYSQQSVPHHQAPIHHQLQPHPQPQRPYMHAQEQAVSNSNEALLPLQQQQQQQQAVPPPHSQTSLDRQRSVTQSPDTGDETGEFEEGKDDFKTRHPTAIPKMKKNVSKVKLKKVVKPEILRNSSSARPFPCTQDACEWSFARLSDLKRHMKSHQPPQFQCPYWRNDPTCHRNGGAFNRLDVLKRHLKLVHFVQDRALYPPKVKYEQGWCRSCQNQFNNVKDFLNHVDDCSSKLNPTEWKQHYDSSNLKGDEKDGASTYLNMASNNNT